ncbi:RNA polymerase sigma factor [Zavarzinia sp. CC-PAN008]|uniref:RNA polymerase sigma factor n=1 Tax=Zavarzinia sp. CC-PAN008 TaxID=3243332 RepID=UPI003F749200
MPGKPTAEAIGAVYRAERTAVLASLARQLRDLDLAEEALQDAFMAAMVAWPRDGLPRQPRAWLITAGRHRAIDRLRRRIRHRALVPHLATLATAPEQEPPALGDDRLGLILLCCDPGLAPEAQLALTLREVCGLTTEAIAAAFRVPAPTLAQRIVRAKAQLRAQPPPLPVPGEAAWGPDLAARLPVVLRVLYLVFSEGYSATLGEEAVRAPLSVEAIRLSRLLAELVPVEAPGGPDVLGLLALMLFHEARAATRLSPGGDLVRLEQQDRARWDQALIAEATALLEQALASRRFGPYTLQAAIAALHAQAPTAEATDWAEIAGLYALLARADPSPLVALNRAVAVAMRDGPEAGLILVERLLARGQLADYHHAHAVRAELCLRLGRTVEARAAFATALAQARQAPEQRHLARRLAALGP